MRRGRKILADKAPTTRSKVTNGRALFLPGVDGRSALARRARDVAAAITADLGGVERLSEAQMQMVRRATVIAVSCERMEAEAMAGKTIDLDEYGKLTDRLGRALQRLGLRRVMADISPRLREYIDASSREGLPDEDDA